MSEPRITVFYCGDKDCARAWERISDRDFGKWCKRTLRDADIRCKLEAIETECWDRCDEAGCLCVTSQQRVIFLEDLRSAKDQERFVAAVAKLLS